MDADLQRGLLGQVLKGTQDVRYQLDELVGEGRSGWVFKATPEGAAGTSVAVKVFRPELLRDEAALPRFAREAERQRTQLEALPDRRWIAQVLDHGALDGPGGALAFLVREHVPGQNLSRVIAGHGGFGLPVARARRIMGSVALGLFALHEVGLLHHALRPSQIVIALGRGAKATAAERESPRITDNRLLRVDDPESLDPTSLAYGAPEDLGLVNGDAGLAADVYSFAAILHELLCGTAAFAQRPGEPRTRFLLRIAAGERPQLGRVRATLPAELRDRPEIVAGLDRELGRATSADPGLRHGSIRELWLALEPLLREAVRRGASGGSAPDEPVTFDSVFPRSLDSASLRTPPPSSRVPSAPMPASAARSGPSPVAAPMPAWSLLGAPIPGEALRAAMIIEDERAILGLGAQGLVRLAHDAWSRAPLPPHIDARALRGLSRLPSGELLLFGAGGLCAAISPRGQTRAIALPDRDVTLLAAHADERGILLAGERASRRGGVAIVVPVEGAPWTIDVPWTTRLSGVTRTSSGHALAVGPHGALVQLVDRAARDVPWGRTGHLHAIAAGPGGLAYAVGSGGHALRIEPAHGGPTATLEGVQTTRDLLSVTVDPTTGAAWAVGADARLLWRKEGTWVRVPLDPWVTGALVMVWPRGERIVVVAEDGAAFACEVG